jgi:hypothetical protein
MKNGLEALEKIKNIELSHIEQSRVENYDDDYDYYYFKADDGTVEECYADEIETVEKELYELEELRQLEKELDCSFKDLYHALKSDCVIEFNGQETIAHAKGNKL